MPPCGGIFCDLKRFGLEGGTYGLPGCAGIAGTNCNTIGGAVAVAVVKSTIFHVTRHTLQMLTRLLCRILCIHMLYSLSVLWGQKIFSPTVVGSYYERISARADTDMLCHCFP